MCESNLIESARVVAGLDEFAELSDEALLEAQRLISAHQRQLDLYRVRCAAEIVRRSGAELGFSGLARRNGFVNAEALLQSVTGSTKADAVKFTRVGEMMIDPALPDTGEVTWRGALGEAVVDGTITVDAANVIQVGLGSTSAAIDNTRMLLAAESLVHEAASTDAEQLARRARQVRDELDAEGITAREHERRQLRHFGVRRRDDGMVVGSFALSDEDGALALAIYEQATAPKRLGPRFVETGVPAADAPADDQPVLDQPELADPRTRGQKAADAFVGLLRIGVEADPGFVLGHDRPAVRVLVSAETVAARAGHGRIEGAPEPISFETVERHLCAAGVVGVAFDDDGQCVNVGRDQRLFTRKQRIGLAARDGGCRFPDCDRPPSWTEAHHIDYWGRDGGETNLADGILLCRLHHLLIHDNHWQIRRDRGDYWLTPPPGIDPEQQPRLMPSKQPLLRELLAAN